MNINKSTTPTRDNPQNRAQNASDGDGSITRNRNNDSSNLQQQNDSAFNHSVENKMEETGELLRSSNRKLELLRDSTRQADARLAELNEELSELSQIVENGLVLEIPEDSRKQLLDQLSELKELHDAMVKQKCTVKMAQRQIKEYASTHQQLEDRAKKFEMKRQKLAQQYKAAVDGGGGTPQQQETFTTPMTRMTPEDAGNHKDPVRDVQRGYQGGGGAVPKTRFGERGRDDK